MDQCEGKVLEEEEAKKLAHSDVRPAPVHEQESLQKTELSKSEVAGHHSLHPLLTADADANVCGWRNGAKLEDQINLFVAYTF